MNEILFWVIVGPLALLGGMLVFGMLFGNTRSGDFADPPCSPSRKSTPTARPAHTSYPSRQNRWIGLERSVKERERVKK